MKDAELNESSLALNLTTVNQAVSRGDFIQAMKGVITSLKDHSNDIRPYETAFHVLSSAVSQPNVLDGLPDTNRTNLYKKLLLQEDCVDKPLAFHHGVASLLTSNNQATARAITEEIKPAVVELLKEGAPSKELVLYFLVARSILGSYPSQHAISKWHADYFAMFTASNLQLPYSTMFNQEVFGANRGDLLRMFANSEVALRLFQDLNLVHLLLLDWLIGKVLFADSDNSALLTLLRSRLTTEDLPQSEMRAGRSLILKYWQRESVISDQGLEALGVVKGIELIQKRTRLRENEIEHNSHKVHQSQQRSYQLLQVVRGMIGRIFPPVVQSQKRVRVAVCVSGQLRGFKLALRTWKKSLLAYCDFDIYIHSWSVIGHANPQPFRSVLPFEGQNFCAEWRRIGMLEGFDVMQERYPSLFTELASSGKIDAELLIDEYSIGSKRATVVVEDESDCCFENYTNQDKMHYKIHAAQGLAYQSGKEYDLFVRIRPDLPVQLLAFDWRDLVEICRTGNLIFSDHAFGVHYGKPMIGDQLAIGSPEAMETYAATWIDFPAYKQMDLAEYPGQLAGHVSLAYQCWLNGIQVEKVPSKLGELLDPEPLPCKRIQHALMEDTKDRCDRIDLGLIEANARDCKL